MPIVKMFEVGYKRTGDIQAVKISNQASEGGEALAEVVIFRASRIDCNLGHLVWGVHPSLYS